MSMRLNAMRVYNYYGARLMPVAEQGRLGGDMTRAPIEPLLPHVEHRRDELSREKYEEVARSSGADAVSLGDYLGHLEDVNEQAGAARRGSTPGEPAEPVPAP